jgi:predicted Fe-Mo cluster-binding NifX family protein
LKIIINKGKIMRIAIPVIDDSLRIAKNAGHTPFFAVFDISGGMFKTITLEELRANPKMAGHEVDEEEHSGKHVCEHDADDMEHIKAHDLMSEVIKDCEYLVIKSACKNTANSMKEFGIKMKKYSGEKTNAKEALGEISGEF